MMRHLLFCSAVAVCSAFLSSPRANNNKHIHRYHPWHHRFASIAETVTTCNNNNDEPIGTMTFLIPSQYETYSTKFGTSSPVGTPGLLEAVRHLCNKSYYFSDGLVTSRIVSLDNNILEMEQLLESTIVIALGIQDASEIKCVEELFERRKAINNEGSLCHFALECSRPIPGLVGPYDPTKPSFSSNNLPWTRDASARRIHEQMNNLFDRWTSDDFAYAIMIFLNAFSGHQVAWVKHTIDATWEKGPIRNAQEVFSMADKCGDCIGKCVKDENCRKCITELTKIDSRDQVTSYRTIVSYESDLLRDFTLCIMTKNNIFNCEATIPMLPKVQPISSWRSTALTEEAARSILVGHLDDPSAPTGTLGLPVSWKVACGANVAYDQFPSQNQLFYPAARGRDMWYDPVFRVTTLDGRNIWCKRHYKVRPAEVPGTFRLSVLDNGVTSNEFWTIIGVADDLSWCAMHYAGAASEVGQRYLGGLLCTPDGQLPDTKKLPEIWDVFRSAGIEPWELYQVKNDDTSTAAKEAGVPPLDFYRSQVLQKRQAAAVQS